MPGDIWHILGIEPTEDLRAIKRAYARKVRQNNPEDAPEKFQAIRNAYEIAISYADRKTAHVNLKINHHPQSGWFDEDPRKGLKRSSFLRPLWEPTPVGEKMG